ncbi:MAG: GAF domain-containing protein [Clostridia bacterium]|nr:GAF domain-containing protein [Clostridia bacterium]
MTDYRELNATLRSLIGGVPHLVANLANASALLYEKLDRLNWAGFYLIEDEKLVLNAFQGKVACIEIPIGRGVCGSAVAERKTLVVPDVHKFPGHIACDGASNSEIVIPLFKGDEIFGVLDIDSPVFDRFDDNDKAGLEEFALILSSELQKTNLI